MIDLNKNKDYYNKETFALDDFGLDNYIELIGSDYPQLKEKLQDMGIDITKPLYCEYFPDENYKVKYYPQFICYSDENIDIDIDGVKIVTVENNSQDKDCIIIEIDAIVLEWKLWYSYQEVINKYKEKKVLTSQEYIKKGFILVSISFLIIVVVLMLVFIIKIEPVLIPIFIIISLPFILSGGYNFQKYFAISKNEKLYKNETKTIKESFEVAHALLDEKSKNKNNSWYILNDDFYFVYTINLTCEDSDKYVVVIGITPIESYTQSNGFISASDCYYRYDFNVKNPNIEQTVKFLATLKNKYFKDIDNYQYYRKDIEKIGVYKNY